MPKPTKRSALEVLTKKRLVVLVDGFEVGTAHSESKHTFVAELAGSSTIESALDQMHRLHNALATRVTAVR